MVKDYIVAGIKELVKEIRMENNIINEIIRDDVFDFAKNVIVRFVLHR